MGDSRDGRRPPSMFPFWSYVGRYVGMLIAGFWWWAVVGLVASVVFSVVVGPMVVWDSLVGFVDGVGAAVGFVVSRSDALFVSGVVVYGVWVVLKRELLGLKRPRYSRSARLPRSVWLGGYVVLSGVVGVLLAGEWFGIENVGFGGFDVGVSSLAVVFFVFSYVVASGLTRTLREDKELHSWFGFEAPWKFVAWVSVSYNAYYWVEGGFESLPVAVSAVLVYGSVLVSVLYLVRRVLGHVGVWTGSGLAGREHWDRARGIDDEHVGNDDEAGDDGGGSGEGVGDVGSGLDDLGGAPVRTVHDSDGADADNGDVGGEERSDDGDSVGGEDEGEVSGGSGLFGSGESDGVSKAGDDSEWKYV